MSDDFTLQGQLRVLIIDDDLMAVRAALVRFTEAGMDCRYAPPGVAAVEAARSLNPHVILLGVWAPTKDALKFAVQLDGDKETPLLILTDSTVDIAEWHLYFPNHNSYIPKDAPPQAILERTAGLIKERFQQAQLMIADTPATTTVQGLQPGWGKCQNCGYIGPRPKFTDSNPLARHSLICPVCKRSDEVVFSVA